MQHAESKEVYETPKNLIITFERGTKNNNLKIYFEEKIKFNQNQVKKNFDLEYSLMGIIAENNFEVKDKYCLYLKKEDNWIICNYDDEIKIHFNDIIRSNLNVVCLFYYQTQNASSKFNIFNYNNINNYDNVNNFINRYIYNNQNNMNLNNIKQMTNKKFDFRKNNIMTNSKIINANRLGYMNFNRNNYNSLFFYLSSF